MKDYMKISDFQLSTVLSSMGYEIKELDDSNPRRIQFCFAIDENESIYQAVDAFWKGTLSLEPKALFYHQKLIKNRIFSVSQR
jgi:hypothetical protein